MNIDLGSMTTQQMFWGSSLESCAERFLAGRHAPLLTRQMLSPCVARVAADWHYQEESICMCSPVHGLETCLQEVEGDDDTEGKHQAHCQRW